MVDRLIFASRRLAAWQEVLERGYEGLLAKDESRRTVVAGRALVDQGPATGVPGGGAWLGAGGQSLI